MEANGLMHPWYLQS